MKHILMIALFAARGAFAGHEMHKVEMPKEFDTVKNLVGTWEGTGKMEGKDEKVTATYELTSGGTAVMEKLMPGTPGEMVSVYHKNGKTLAMTHYCSIGNQPFMPLKKADDKTLTFEMTKPVGLTSAKEEHMHALTVTFTGADTMTQEWVHYKDGKKSGSAVFTFTRKKT